MIPTSIPSPPLSWSAFSIGPLTIHAYALFILAGIFFALWYTTRRWVERGGDAEAVSEVAFWAIPFGIVGGRIYHVISTPGPYFGAGGEPLDAFKIWEGGLGIWGAVALGAVGAYIGAKRHQVSFTAFLDAAAPAVLIAQAIGRLGNYMNQELYGAATTLPWGLEIADERLRAGYESGTLFHPTFLYELLWNLAGAALIVYLDRKWNLRGGRVFWLYVIVYTSGRLWIETLRIDEAVIVGGLRINVWVSIAVLLGAIAIFVVMGRRQRGQSPQPPRATLAASQARTAPAHVGDAKKVPAAAAVPARKQPAAKASAAKKPATGKPAAKKPATDESTAKKPASNESTAQKPAAKASASKKPAAKKPAASKATPAAKGNPRASAASKPRPKTSRPKPESNTDD